MVSFCNLSAPTKNRWLRLNKSLHDREEMLLRLVDNFRRSPFGSCNHIQSRRSCTNNSAKFDVAVGPSCLCNKDGREFCGGIRPHDQISTFLRWQDVLASKDRNHFLLVDLDPNYLEISQVHQ